MTEPAAAGRLLIASDGASILEAGAASMGMSLTATQSAHLLAYAALILKWNKVYNLTALRDPQTVLTHHLLDSLTAVGPLMPIIAPVMPGTAEVPALLDVGSGAGLPGVVLAIMRSDIQVDCVDSVAKKAAFIQQVVAELQLPNVRSMHARVEDSRGQYAVVCSRAFASLADFTGTSTHLLAPGGVWMAMKGKSPTDEIAALPSDIDVFHVEQLAVPSVNAQRCIVWMRKHLA